MPAQLGAALDALAGGVEGEEVDGVDLVGEVVDQPLRVDRAGATNHRLAAALALAALLDGEGEQPRGRAHDRGRAQQGPTTTGHGERAAAGRVVAGLGDAVGEGDQQGVTQAVLAGLQGSGVAGPVLSGMSVAQAQELVTDLKHAARGA